MTSFRYGYSYGFITRWNRCFICQNRRRYELWKERGVDRDSSYSQCLGYQCCRYVTDLYALSRYFDANHRASVQEPQVAGSSRSEQEHEEANLRLSQLQHQLPANEPGALMHLVQHASSEVEEDEAIRDCKNLFLNKKFFLSREVLLVNGACHGDGKRLSIMALEEKRARLGLVECVNHDLLQPYSILHEKPGDHVAHINFTVLLMPNGSDRITSYSLQEMQPTKTIDDPEIKAWLALSTYNWELFCV